MLMEYKKFNDINSEAETWTNTRHVIRITIYKLKITTDVLFK